MAEQGKKHAEENHTMMHFELNETSFIFSNKKRYPITIILEAAETESPVHSSTWSN